MESEEQWLEIHRLAVLGTERSIAQAAMTTLARAWVRVSRFRDVETRCQQTLTLGTHAGSLYYLAWAQERLGQREEALRISVEALRLYKAEKDESGQAMTLNNIGLVYAHTGHPEQALDYFQQALPLMEAVGKRAGQATTLSNIGLVYADTGHPEQALAYFQQALPLMEAVGDRAGLATTRFNLARLYRQQGRLAEAVAELQQVVALEEQLGHPDFAADHALLRQVETEWQMIKK